MSKLKQISKIREIKKLVGKPYFETDRVLLYKMDCLEFMKKLNQPMIDLTITSPPYNIGKEYEKIMPINEYLNWCKQWMSQVFEITNRYGSFWLNLGYFKIQKKGTAIPISYLLWNKSPFYFMQEIVWHYGAGISARRMFTPRNEKYLWYVKNPNSYVFNLDAIRDKNVKYPNQTKNGILKVNPNGKNPTNVWNIPKVTSGNGRASKDRTSHPAQFPIEIINRIVRACSNPNDLIFDPFMGSGTVCVASIQNKRFAVGCEINPKYIKIAKNRIQKFITKTKS